jgi:hypothetical protein
MYFSIEFRYNGCVTQAKSSYLAEINSPAPNIDHPRAVKSVYYVQGYPKALHLRSIKDLVIAGYRQVLEYLETWHTFMTRQV